MPRKAAAGRPTPPCTVRRTERALPPKPAAHSRDGRWPTMATVTTPHRGQTSAAMNSWRNASIRASDLSVRRCGSAQRGQKLLQVRARMEQTRLHRVDRTIHDRRNLLARISELVAELHCVPLLNG